MKRSLVPGLLAAGAAAAAAPAGSIVITQSGTDVEVADAVDKFREALGPLNPNVPGSFGRGRREINWDTLPDEVVAPNGFPGDFLNGNATGRARGAIFSTPGRGFQVSADAGNAAGTPPNFANLNPQYGDLFRAFSPQRMFTAIGSTTTVVNFFVPGTDTPATVRGFGAVFSDIDAEASTELFFYDANGRLLERVFVPIQTALNGGATFAGVLFDSDNSLARVVIISGVVRLGPGQNEGPSSGDVFDDAVVMDDFIYGEPVGAEAPCAGDVDGDDRVDLGDLTEVLGSFGLCVPILGFNPAADLDGNGCVDMADLLAVLANFDRECR